MHRRKNIQKKGLNNKNIHTKKILVVLVVLIGISAAVFRSSYVNVEEMENQLQQNLTDVARRNAEILRTKIDIQYQLLDSLAKELQEATPETIEEKLDQFIVFIDDFDLKRFAFCFPDGMTYSTDGEATNLSYREFFKKGMVGESCITGTLNDAIRSESGLVNVMTIPVYDEEKNISGVFGVAYDTERFNESLLSDSFDGQGYCCIVSEEGEIMAIQGSDDLVVSHNIFEDVRNADTKNEQMAEELQKQMEQKKEGGGIVYLSGENYYYSVPLELMNGYVTWHILTIIPSEVLEQRVIPIQKNQYQTSLCVAIFVVIGAVLVIIFIKEQNEQVFRVAYEDALTNGANAAKFYLDMEKRRNKQAGYMVVMDIDNFNNIMIVAGKEASDTMIKETWRIICDSLYKEEVAGHVRDDMFLLFLQAPDEEALIQRMEQISQRVGKKARDFRVYGLLAKYGVYPMSGEENVEEAYSKAKVAREYALKKPELHYTFYNEVNRMKMQYEKQLEENFPLALEQEEFEAWYQPKYSVADGTIVGSEALVRWRKDNGEMISPGEFIPLFEQNGMIMKLDEYMFRTVCRQQKKWLDEGKKVYPVSINISRASLYCADVDRLYGAIMEECGIEPQYIQLEVTETVIGGKADIRVLLNKFRKMGVKILMDDFGTGYSSLNTLSAQCFDTLKLDKTLIDNIGDESGETLLYHRFVWDRHWDFILRRKAWKNRHRSSSCSV